MEIWLVQDILSGIVKIILKVWKIEYAPDLTYLNLLVLN